MADVTQYLKDRMDYINEHLRIYLESDGEHGHYVDPPEPGARKDSTALLLQTIGRKSGNKFTVPLFYEKVGDDFIIIASKGGSDKHPVWYLNMLEQAEVRVQAGRDKYRASWRILEGDERQVAWDKIAAMYPTYHEYQKITDRVIPVIALTPVEKVPAL